jgi:hypothetical protein
LIRRVGGLCLLFMVTFTLTGPTVASAGSREEYFQKLRQAAEEGRAAREKERTEELARCAQSKDPVLCEILVTRLRALERAVSSIEFEVGVLPETLTGALTSIELAVDAVRIEVEALPR